AAGDRSGRRAAGPVLPAARPARVEDRRPRPHRPAPALCRGGGRTASPGVPAAVLENLGAVAAELRAQQSKPAATPEEARAANAALREAMRERGNYFEVIEREAAGTLRAAGYSGGALS